jgi:integrase
MAVKRGSQSKPLMRQNGYWYCNLIVGGEKRQFGLNAKGQEQEPKAWEEFQRLKDGLCVSNQIQGTLTSVANVLDYYQAFLDKHHAKQASFARDILPRWKATFGRLKIEEFTAAEVEDFLDRKEWSSTTRYQYGSLIRAAFNLATKRGKIETSPLKGLKLPKSQSRIRWLTEQQEQHVLATAPEDFRQLILVCLRTGGRPLSEVASVSISDPDKYCDLEKGVWLFRKHKTEGKSSRNREIVLRPDILEICKQQAVKYPEGPLFRTASGKQWTKGIIAQRWIRLRKKLHLPSDCVFYSLRHTFATRLLLKGASIHDVACLMGNSVAMVERHYSHLIDAKDRLLDRLALLG